MMRAIAAVFLIPMLGLNLWAFELPYQLSSYEQNIVAETLGLGTSTKHLTNPFPLGGYSGFEIGASVQSIDATRIATLGTGNANIDHLSQTQLSFAKGLFNNIDTHVSFTPLSFPDGQNSYNGLLKWGFYQADYMPLNFALAAHFASFSMSNRFASTSLGGDILGGFNFTNTSFYLGFGMVDVFAHFMGGSGSGSTTLSGQAERIRLKRFHSFVGATYHLDPLFVAFEVDRYEDLVYSGKLGARF